MKRFKLLGLLLLAVLTIAAFAATPQLVDKRLFVSLREWSATEAVAASTTGVHAAVTDNGATQTVTTSITNPPCPRNITATAGGTSGDVKAIQVTVTGKRNGKVISEALPAFTVNTTGTVSGSKIFDEVTSISIPAHDGTGATTAIGFGELFGLPYIPAYPTVIAAYNDGALDTSSTITVGDTLETTYFNPEGSADGSVHALIYLRP